ncbi:MAG: hypothetical protein KDA89_19875 [Planctomycetaceae bacterium]|nr:hypothetical protein [Planctomycetaceae bacterium]
MSEKLSDSDHSTSETSRKFTVAFWNLQNLFDIDGSALATEMEYTPVNGWNRRALELRMTQIADVVRSMFSGVGPDLLGLCGVENDRLAGILMEAIGRSDYRLAMTDSVPADGTGTALVFSADVFEPESCATAGHVTSGPWQTRSLLETELQLKDSAVGLTVLVSHWPSNVSGSSAAEGEHLAAAAQCARLVDRRLKLPRREYLQLRHNEISLHQLNTAWDRNLLVMGDFGEPPWGRGLCDVLQAEYSYDRLSEPIRLIHNSLPSYRSYAAGRPVLFNPMWSLLSQPDQGTVSLSERPVAMQIHDQFLFSRGLQLGLQGLRPVADSAGVPLIGIHRDGLADRNGRPRPLRSDKSSGAGDHFPITTSVNIL